MGSQTYDFALSAGVGSARVVQAAATRCKLLTCTGTGITVRTDTGKVFRIRPGQGFRADPANPFRELIISNPDTSANIGTLFVGDDDFLDERITGDVNVIDSAANKTRAGLQFISSPSRTASVGNLSVVSVWPNGSVLAVKRIQIFSSVAGTVLLVSGTGNGTAQATISGMNNKRLGGPSSTARVSDGLAVTFPFTAAEMPGFSYVASIQVQANTTSEFPLTTPFVLDGSQGATPVLAIAPLNQNRDIGVTFDVEEV